MSNQDDNVLNFTLQIGHYLFFIFVRHLIMHL